MRLRFIGFLALLVGVFALNPTTSNGQPANPWPELTLTPLAPAFDEITEIANAGDGSHRLFVVERRGAIRIVEPGGQTAPGFFLDIRPRVRSSGGEQGLLGLAFSPSYESDRMFYVNYTDSAGDTVVASYRATDPNNADEATEDTVLAIEQPAGNHNGGHLAFGSDGLLYIGMGDGGGSGDQQNRAQTDSGRLGKMLRYDPATRETTTIAKGLRNPWKFTFDRATGDIYIADVGQNEWEEVNFIAAGQLPGKNFGWRLMEGAHCFNPSTACPQGGLELPIAEYSHDDGCSITGGYVVREPASTLNGIYLYSDFCTGVIWGLRRDTSGRWEHEVIGDAGGNVTTFGEGEDGAVYIAIERQGWQVYRISADAAAPQLPPLPFRSMLASLAADGPP